MMLVVVEGGGGVASKFEWNETNIFILYASSVLRVELVSPEEEQLCIAFETSTNKNLSMHCLWNFEDTLLIFGFRSTVDTVMTVGL